jgi:hypothetical protein
VTVRPTLAGKAVVVGVQPPGRARTHPSRHASTGCRPARAS